MTPKEKANELVQEYVINMPLPFHIEDAKICALIAVDQLVNESSEKIHRSGRCYLSDREYWKRVKKEIEKL